MTQQYTNFHQLLEDPLVMAISAGWLFESGIAVCDRVAGGRPCRVIVILPWNLRGILQETTAFAVRLGKIRPNYLLTFMCPTEAETGTLLAAGLDAIHIHHNAFLDERIHRPDPQKRRDFDAVHIAQSRPFKRHDLAWNVPNLAVITYDSGGRDSIPGAEPDQTIGGYRHLAYCNWTQANGLTILTPEEVAQVTRRAGCGLILSAVEGSNFATTEYMLNGLPVVSTPSKGGRDEVYDPRFVRIVPPEAAEVEAAVADWNAGPPDPWQVHQATMALLRPHRLKFLQWLSAATGQDLLADATADYWSPLFTNRLRQGTAYDPTEITARIPGPTARDQARAALHRATRAARLWLRL